MKSKMGLSVALSLALVFMVVGPAEAKVQLLSKEEVSDLIVGRTCEDNHGAKLTFGKDGKYKHERGKKTFNGTYEVVEKGVKITFKDGKYAGRPIFYHIGVEEDKNKKKIYTIRLPAGFDILEWCRTT